MFGKTVAILLCCAIILGAAGVSAQGPDRDSDSWAAIVHEENSIRASLLYLPFMIFQLPVRLIDGIIYPKSTTHATIPPQAHKGHPLSFPPPQVGAGQ